MRQRIAALPHYSSHNCFPLTLIGAHHSQENVQHVAREATVAPWQLLKVTPEAGAIFKIQLEKEKKKKKAMWGQRQLHPYRTALLFLPLKDIKENSREACGVWENFTPDFSAASVSHFKNFIFRQFCMECRCLNPSPSEPLFDWPQLHNTFSHTEFLLQTLWDAVI